MERTAIQRLVERRMREWELSSAQAPPKPGPTPTAIHPYVAISRTLGSGGRDVADRLHEQLGWPVYDKEILNYIAEDDDIQRRLYASADEQTTSWLERMTAPFRAEGPQPRDDYFHKLIRAVRTIAAGSSAIFVGRGVGFILPAEQGLRVRLVAPIERCVETFAARAQLTASEGAAVVRATNAARTAFLRDRFGEDTTAEERYALTINTATFPPDVAAQLIVAAVRARFGEGKVPSTSRGASPA